MPPDLSSGDTAALEYAHFRVQRRPDGTAWTLGVGGMGMTYKATDTRLDKDVALKVIHPSRLGDTEVQRLFVREARAAARVSHSNVAAVSFLEDRAGTFFYAMEFVEGVSLHTYLRRQGPLPPARALAFAEQIALGLGAIHGGLAGAWMLSRINEKVLRLCVVGIGVALTIGLFLHPV